MNDVPAHISISPRHGTRRFRRNARLTVADGVLTATDRNGASSSVALDGSPSTPTWVTFREDPVLGRHEMAFTDPDGNAFVITALGHWDSFERNDLTDAAGLLMVDLQPHDAPRLRPDGRYILDSTWWKYTPQVGPLGFAAGMLSMAIEPLRWLGFAILIAAFTYSMAALFSGAFAKHRKGPAYEAEQAFLKGDKHAFDAFHEARRKRLLAAGRADLLPPEPETETGSA
jgi:hypothetical protein